MRSDDDLLAVLFGAADAVRDALDGLDDWDLADTRPGQYRSDLAADAACLGMLDAAGLGWLSEESGVAHPERAIRVIVDPVDGSTNASLGVPWFATSLCAVDAEGPRVAVVVNQATGRRFHAVRGGGAFADSRPIGPTTATEPREAIVGISGWPPQHLGWAQFRCFGAAALDLCAVAEGMLDAFVDCSPSAHGAWDHAGGALICREAGAVVAEAFDRDLLPMAADERRTPMAAATPQLLDALVDARRALSLDGDPA